jgi:hypothetical protein
MPISSPTRRLSFSLRLDLFLQRRLGGHVSFRVLGRRVTIYGFNAMHVQFEVKTRRWGHVCFHPTVRCFGAWWPWKFYVSPNATPWASTFAIGPGLYDSDRAGAILRRSRFGHNFDTEARREDMERIKTAL